MDSELKVKYWRAVFSADNVHTPSSMNRFRRLIIDEDRAGNVQVVFSIPKDQFPEIVNFIEQALQEIIN
jgi:hypothetical protein